MPEPQTAACITYINNNTNETSQYTKDHILVLAVNVRGTNQAARTNGFVATMNGTLPTRSAYMPCVWAADVTALNYMAI
jgi:hypothetical protein